jgi:predicted small lipoprotein YifL
MIKRLKLLLAVVVLLFGLTGCGQLKAAIPHHVVTAAVTRQAQQEQVDLWRQLAADDASLPQLSVNRVKVSRVRQVQVADELAYEVTGTYRYKLRYPQRSPLSQSQVPFSVIVQESLADEQWQLLEVEGSLKAPKAWHWRSLNAPAA